MKEIWQLVRNFLFSKANKELLIFLFFLGLSGIFWLNMALNETYEKEFAIPVSVVGIPKNAVLTSDEVDTVRMTIRDRGFTLLTYMYGDVLKKISISFKTYSKNNGTGSVSAQDLQKMVYQQLASGSRITSVKPEKLEFYYNYGAKKMVPVRWSGRVIPEELYFISSVHYSPDSVTIYASEEKLDSINMVYTEQLNYANFRDTLIANCELSKIKGVKMVPDHVKVAFFTDVLTEERIEGIPVEGINMPPGMLLRTFPAKVTVSFVTGVSTFRNLKSDDFSVIADYNEIKKDPSEKCHIYLKKVPGGISRARLETTLVDYLIESETE
ncbi:MAG: YbbR-like domain-containing protein [Prevotella sp.]|nr:YbbR-like domain-containing protein [Prevotella sp.]